MKKIFSFLMAVLLTGTAICAQAPDVTIDWSSSANDLGDGLYEIVLTGKIADGWHTYDLSNEFSATEVNVEEGEGYSLEGMPYEIGEAKDDGNGNKCYYGEIKLGQKVRVTAASAAVKGTVTWIACSNQFCASPEDWDFTENLTGTGADTAVSDADNQETEIAPAEESEKSGNSIWGLIIEAILWGFAMLLTPCVFPMIPMTISFFMKGSSSPAAGRFKAFMYGLFIVLLYTVPISLIIGITRIIGGDAVTADIFNWLATHWIPNIIFFIIFMVFAASFFGAFEITLPSSLVNKSDANSDKKGLAGIFFMALTLVLVSFSCTGPIVGSVLIKSTQGEFWTPMITMLAFSVAFALPFTIFAMFPSLLKKLKSGSWLNSVKVVLGFIEIALGFKFLSVPDQTYHWHLLDREVYLAIWIVTFTLLGLYLLGKIRFENDSEVKHLSVFRLALSIVVFTFVVYMIPGMWGAPLKALSGYLPPIETQDFVVLSQAEGGNVVNVQDVAAAKTPAVGDAELIELPHGLKGYNSLEAGLAAAKAAGKPLFVDITGHGCTNCREMEARVWSDPKVLEILRDDYVMAALYTDDKTKLDEKDWITDENGKVYKDLGRKNSYIVRTRFGVNAQPNYALLSPDGDQLVPVRGYNLSVDGFVDFLKSGLAAYNK